MWRHLKMAYDKYQSYLQTLGEVITEYAYEAKKNRDGAKNQEKKDFYEGYLSAYYRIVTLMQQHAEPFEISLNELGLENIKEEDMF